MSFDREHVKRSVAKLAERGVYIGTSSWKYPGWVGSLYEEQRYISRLNKFSKSIFEAECLTEYAQVFKTVCFDGAYYKFPTVEFLEGMASRVPADFRFGFKVTETVTKKKYTKYDGPKLAGQLNEFYLNAGKFTNDFLGPCEQIRSKVGILIFEFSTFYADSYEQGRDFIADLDRFFAKIPSGWPYGVELRNKNWLTPEYFACLAKHGIAHVFNSWAHMPPVSEQRAMPGSRTNDGLSAARFLLKPGRDYEQAVKQFSPYNSVKETYEEARKAGAGMIVEAIKRPKQMTFLFVNIRCLKLKRESNRLRMDVDIRCGL